MEKEKFLKAMRVANVIFTQLANTTDVNVIFSWGIRGYGAGYLRGRDGIEMPCLILDVSGLIHTGRVAVALNEGADEYEIVLYDENGTRLKWLTGVTCDTLGSLLDALIEHPVGMSDEDYNELSALDSFVKSLTESE